MDGVDIVGRVSAGSRAGQRRIENGKADSIPEEAESENATTNATQSSSQKEWAIARAKSPLTLVDMQRSKREKKRNQQVADSASESTIEGKRPEGEGEREGRRNSMIGKVAHKAKLAIPLKLSGLSDNSQSSAGKSSSASSKQSSPRQEASTEERRMSADQGQVDRGKGGDGSASGHVKLLAFPVDKHKKLPHPISTGGDGGPSSSVKEDMEAKMLAQKSKLSPTEPNRPSGVPPRSTSNDTLNRSHSSPAPRPTATRKSSKIMDMSTAELNVTDSGKEHNARSLLASPSLVNGLKAEARKKPSMNSIKEGTEVAGPSSEQESATGVGAHAQPHGPTKPSNLRSTSAIKINSMSSTTVSNQTSKSNSDPLPRREKKSATMEPPMPDPPAEPEVEPAPASGMHWSKAPCFGHDHNALRAHTTTLVGSSIYVLGGCDSNTCFNDLYVFDADCMYWTSPECSGDIPPPLRAMTATAVGKKIVIFGGGDGPTYYNDIYVLDTISLRFTRPKVLGTLPSKRRAHTACLYKHGIYVFGGGDGVKALNDVWKLDVSDTAKVTWRLISPPSKSSSRPTARGYHTANMVGSKLIIFGGSDGLECFRDVWVFDVETQAWRAVEIEVSYPRLSHTATVIGSYLFVIGGHDGVDYSSHVLLLNLVTMQWDRRKVHGTPPSGRGYHGTVLHDSRLFVIGGFDGYVSRSLVARPMLTLNRSTVFDDTYVLDLAVNAYYSQISHFTVDV